VEEARGLAAEVERLRGRVVARQRAGALRQRDDALDEGAQLLRLRHGRDDALVARVDQRGREVAEHRHAVLARPPEFPVCVQVSHDKSLNLLFLIFDF
jgi:hypothetical protein